MTRWLALRLAFATRRFFAPELSLSDYREQLATDEGVDWSLDAAATWFAVMAILGALSAALLPIRLGSVDASAVALALIGASLVLVMIYTAQYVSRRRQKAPRSRRRRLHR